MVDAKVDPSAVQGAIAGASGVLVSAPDPSRVLDAFERSPGITSAVYDAWSGGKTLLLDNAAAAAAGEARQH